MNAFKTLGRLALIALLLGGCEYYDKPNRPVSDDFVAITLTGERLEADHFRDRPWVINLWVPG